MLDTLEAPEAGEMVVVDESTRPKHDRITVLVHLPHLAEFDRPTTTELVYGCNIAVAVGDQVICPPTPRTNKPHTGVVTALDGGQYRGPVKYILGKKD